LLNYYHVCTENFHLSSISIPVFNNNRHCYKNTRNGTLRVILYSFSNPITDLRLSYFRWKRSNPLFYFIFIFCLIGDLTVIIDDFYFFISALMAYWGAAILFCFVLNKELEKALVPLLYKWKYCLPFIFYGSYFILLMYLIKPYLKKLFIPIIIYAATLSFAAALRIIVYIERRTKSIAYLSSGLVLLSITASLIGINRFYYKSDFLHGIETLLYAPTLFLIFLYFKTKTIDEF